MRGRLHCLLINESENADVSILRAPRKPGSWGRLHIDESKHADVSILEASRELDSLGNLHSDAFKDMCNAPLVFGSDRIASPGFEGPLWN